MALARTHLGWENEHLAAFVLSRIAFVATPVTVADDVGTDLFCTLYDRVVRNNVPVLVPRSSIAVQVKSNRDDVDMAPKLEYLARLEMPFYVGVVNQRALTLELFSGRFLPCLLSYRGSHTKLPLVLVETFDRHYRTGDDAHGYKLLCHKVATLAADTTPEATAQAAQAIKEDAAAALQALVSRANQEYIFQITDTEVEIYTGKDSARTFRYSFFKRLAEALLNLEWLIKAKQPISSPELDLYLSLTPRLTELGSVPAFVTQAHERLASAKAAAV